MTAKIFSAKTRLSRRAVLKGGAYGLGLPLAFSPAVSALSAGGARAAPANPERILVVVELDGGNDGLNTVVPYGDDAYYRQRPKIGLPAANLRKLDDHFAFHPALGGFERLYKDGKFAIVHGCGYDNPILSHFAAMGFWHTGVPIAGEKLGWVGRIADTMSPSPRENMIVNIGQAQSLAVRSRVHAPLVFDDPARFMRQGRFEQQPWFASLTGDAGSANGTLAYLSGLAKSALRSGDFVRAAWAD